MANFCVALYDCSGDGPGELTFDEGDKLKVLSKSVPELGEGWWQGKKVGTKVAGYFPSNYVKLLTTAARPSRPSAKPTRSSAKPTVSGRKGKAGGRPTPPSRPTTRVSARPSAKPAATRAAHSGSEDTKGLPSGEKRQETEVKRFVSARVTYTAATPDEISFRKAAKVEIIALGYLGDADVAIGACRSRFGSVAMKQLDVRTSTLAVCAKAPTGRGGAGKLVMQTLRGYPGKRSQAELRFAAGEPIEIIAKEFRGSRAWYFGRHGTTKKWGCFPRVCVSAAPSAPMRPQRGTLRESKEETTHDRKPARPTRPTRSTAGPAELSGSSRAKLQRRKQEANARERAEAREAKVAAARANAVPSIAIATALYDCAGDAEVELSFNAGDTIMITAFEVPEQGEGWNSGFVEGDRGTLLGYFPANYVEVVSRSAPRAARISVVPPVALRAGKRSGGSKPARPSRTSLARQKKKKSSKSASGADAGSGATGGQALSAKNQVKRDAIDRERARVQALRDAAAEEDRLAALEAEEEAEELRLQRKRIERERAAKRKARAEAVAAAEAEAEAVERLAREAKALRAEEQSAKEETKQRAEARDRKRAQRRRELDMARKELEAESARAAEEEEAASDAALARARRRAAAAGDGDAERSPKIHSAARASAARRRTSAKPHSRPSIVPPPRRGANAKPQSRPSIVPPPRRGKARAKAARSAKKVVTALYDVAGATGEELSFTEGDTIEVEETDVPECVLSCSSSTAAEKKAPRGVCVVLSCTACSMFCYWSLHLILFSSHSHSQFSLFFSLSLSLSLFLLCALSCALAPHQIRRRMVARTEPRKWRTRRVPVELRRSSRYGHVVQRACAVQLRRRRPGRANVQRRRDNRRHRD